MPPDIEERRKAVNSREPERSLFVLVSPKIFKDEPRSRLYGWLMEDYRDYPEHLARDLCHRAQRDWAPVSKRLGWTTWEQANEILPGACGWLAPR
jgi:hypothetical protein